MDKATDALTHADPNLSPEWIAHFDRAYLADQAAHCLRYLDEPRQAVRRAEEALARHPHTRVRRRAIDSLLLASALVQAGSVEEASRRAEQAWAPVRALQSALAEQYLEDFIDDLKLHGGTKPTPECDAKLEESAVRSR